MNGDVLALDGCAPTPLASYLKALGVLRLISSPANHVSGVAADPNARGWWENERFHLRTTLSRDALLRFFLHDYAPSPIIAPWNGRAGFLEEHNEDGTGNKSMRPKAQRIAAIENSTTARVKNLKTAISLLRGNKQISEYRSIRNDGKKVEKDIKTLTEDIRHHKKELEKLAELEKELKKQQKIEKKMKKQEKIAKEALLPSLRSAIDARQLRYIDVCYVLLSTGKSSAAPLLVGGGVDGSRELGSDFIESFEGLFDVANGEPTTSSFSDLTAALFSENTLLDRRGSLGLFTPLQSGLKSTTGTEIGGDKEIYPLNSWDVVLAMEGTLVFAGALTRRWGAASGSRGAFPFTFDPTSAGAGSLSSEDPNRPRGEVWTPLWPKPATLTEIAAIFAEGRLTVGQRTARAGLDAARSVAQLGVSRGIGGFERYMIIQPDSKMPYQATPLGRFDAPDRPRCDLTADLESGNWLEQARRSAGSRKMSPVRARQALRRLENALFQMTTPNHRREGTQNALMALGVLVGWLATSPHARKDCQPPPVISPGWLWEADDGSAEFRIATALAGLGLPTPVQPASNVPEPTVGGSGDEAATAAAPPGGRDIVRQDGTSATPQRLPMAAHLAPLDEKRFFYRGGLEVRRAWHEGAAPPTMIWGAGPLVPNMIAVLERRLVEASIRGLEDKPLAGAIGARLADVAAFLSGDFDDERCAALLAGLVWARPTHLRTTVAAPVPFAYAALKPVFTPDSALQRVGALPGSTRMPVPPGLLVRLCAGGDSVDGRATDLAVRTALARARASGLPTPFDASRSDARRSVIEGGRMGTGVRAARLAAALLIPINEMALTSLIKRAYPGALPENDDMTTEDTTNEA